MLHSSRLTSMWQRDLQALNRRSLNYFSESMKVRFYLLDLFIVQLLLSLIMSVTFMVLVSPGSSSCFLSVVTSHPVFVLLLPWRLSFKHFWSHREKHFCLWKVQKELILSILLGNLLADPTGESTVHWYQRWRCSGRWRSCQSAETGMGRDEFWSTRWSLTRVESMSFFVLQEFLDEEEQVWSDRWGHAHWHTAHTHTWMLECSQSSTLHLDVSFHSCVISTTK